MTNSRYNKETSVKKTRAIALTALVVALGGGFGATLIALDRPSTSPTPAAPEVSPTPVVDEMLAKRAAAREALARTPVAQDPANTKPPLRNAGRWTIPEGFRAPPPDPMDMRFHYPDLFEPAVHEGAIGIGELMNDWPGFNDWFNERVARASFGRVLKCRTELRERGIVARENTKWVFAMHLVATGGTAWIKEVRVIDSHWPPEFDDEAKRCFVDAYTNLTFSTPHEVNALLEWVSCFKAVTVTKEGKTP